MTTKWDQLRLILYYWTILLELGKVTLAKNDDTYFQKQLSCQLQWVTFSRGNEFPNNTIPVNIHSNSLLPVLKDIVPIARKRILGNWTLGSVDKEDVAHFYYKQSFQLWTYEILSNPYNCLIEWVPSTNTSTMELLGVKLGDKLETRTIGRTFIRNRKGWVPCSINTIKMTCSYVDPGGNGQLQASTVFQRLISYVPGLSMSLRNLSFTTKEDIRNIEVMGVDIIRNRAEATLRKTIVHTTTTIRTINWEFGFNFKLEIGLSLNIMKNWLMPRAPDLAGYLSFGQTYTWYQGRSTEERVTITRDVDVPAKTSVEVTTALVTRAISLDVIGEAEITAVGHGADEVAEILRRCGHQGLLTLEGKKVIMAINATFQGTAPFSSEFIILPYNAYKGSSAKKMIEDISKRGLNQKGFQGTELLHFIESHVE